MSQKRSRKDFDNGVVNEHEPHPSKASKIDLDRIDRPDGTNKATDDLDVDKQLKTKIWKYFEEGYTIPFLARYRKEAIGGLGPDALRHLHDEHEVKK